MEKLQLKTTYVDTFRVVGISLPSKTENLNQKSSRDCGGLWKKFHEGNYSSMIPDKINEDVIAIYHQYEGNHLEPFSYMIGHKVKGNTIPLEGLDYIDVSTGEYLKVSVKGEDYECLVTAWKDIWQSDLNRSYLYDFEIYHHTGSNGDHIEVDIFIGIQ
ncbi:GyrI-like domain-containing protein [Anditalea andensis]|uniref:AraC effector-binding domain-containing protein n=1 Tax=Anditalea andensis TaxID=1048983 RepID=A0A074L2B2_9BACT|nr:GyrI-like domain-containing protein [Anditalea andensis]KEO75314.1 hypothetical protein EL17_01885 [Anditalea andensis]